MTPDSFTAIRGQESEAICMFMLIIHLSHDREFKKE